MRCTLDADGAPDDLMSDAPDSAAMIEASIAALVHVGRVDSDRLTALCTRYAS